MVKGREILRGLREELQPFVSTLSLQLVKAGYEPSHPSLGTVLCHRSSPHLCPKLSALVSVAMSLPTSASTYSLSEAMGWMSGGRHVDTERCTDCCATAATTVSARGALDSGPMQHH